MARTPRIVYEYQRIYRPGLTIAEAARQLGCTERTISRARAQLGLSDKVAYRPVDAARLERARRLLEDGASLLDVERSTGLTHKTLRRHFPDHHGWTAHERGVYARQLDKLRKL
ncbi:helix-turn-helix DNA binding domain protein [Arthrobacter phage Renna12]|nr:helix-turn-helix DNA binding domain protein [Arthrobacter phage Renna12]